jgi:DNA-binding MarR family transcriptional regulator
MGPPRIGEHYRGAEGRSGYLLRQAWQAFHVAMETALRTHRLTGAQYAAMSVLAREAGMSGADLARACNTTPQAITGVVATLERGGLVERRPHPSHGRIIQVTLTAEGRQRLAAATPDVRALEDAMEHAVPADDLATVKAWLVASAQRLHAVTGAHDA